MPHTFDLVVIGSGAAAATVAGRCRSAGWSVALVESGPLGGTCALRGCDPKKILVGVAAAIDAARNLDGKGVATGSLALDWGALMRFKRTFTDPVPEQREASLRRQGIVVFHGTARFTGPSSLDVGGEAVEAARAIVIATGATPVRLPIDGADLLVTSDAFLDLPTLPASIAFVGGGFISFEFAHVAARAGARVTILHGDDRPLAAFEPDLVDALVARTRAIGVDVRLGTEVDAVARDGDGFRVRARGGAAVDAALVVHGAGRVPDLEALDCAAGGVDVGRQGVIVDEAFRSVSNPRVFAAGDCAASGGPPLTPVAGYEARILADGLLDAGARTPDYTVVPSAVYTLPPLARVGLGEAEARQRGHEVDVHAIDTSAWYSTRRLGESVSRSKVLVERRSRRVLGAHLLGPGADELINLFALAMRQRVPVEDLADAIWAYPTHASDVPHLVR
ncbi:MAG: NAD(P)/FAD-dependent oxidoreductase [Vicinamibacterales bacterium]